MVEGERVEARLDDASRLFGHVSQIGRIKKSDQRLCRKVQISVTLKVSLRFCSLYSIHGGEIALSYNAQRANINVEVNIGLFSTGERRKRGRNDRYV